jgi:hypothetical protein
MQKPQVGGTADRMKSAVLFSRVERQHEALDLHPLLVEGGDCRRELRHDAILRAGHLHLREGLPGDQVVLSRRRNGEHQTE